jgi:hypothetical protein
MTTLDIRDFGAAVDGTTDDTEAVQAAADSASPGDSVFIPEGITLVSADGGRGPAIRLDESHSGITLRGAGERSVLKMDGGHMEGKNNYVINVRCDVGVSDLDIRDLSIDGNKSNNGGTDTFGVLCWPGGAVNDVLIEDVFISSCSLSGVVLRAAGTKANRVTSNHNGQHGFELRNRYTEQDPPTTITNVLARDNDNLGIDHNGGVAVIEGFWSENNRAGGMKFSRNATDTTVRDGMFKGNGTMGFRWNGGSFGERQMCTLDNVVAVNNAWSGFRLNGNTDYTIGTILAARNNDTGRQGGNVDVTHTADISATEVRSHDATVGAGIDYDSDRFSRIERYIHSANPDGGLTGSSTSDLSIGVTSHDNFQKIDIPAADEVGAWSTRAIAEAVLVENSGAVQSNNGSLMTD